MKYITAAEARALQKPLPPTPAVQGSPTSEAAARAMPGSQRKIDKDKIEAAIRAAGYDGLTDEQGELVTGISGDTYRPRRGELFKEQRITQTNRKRMTRSFREAVVWTAR